MWLVLWGRRSGLGQACGQRRCLQGGLPRATGLAQLGRKDCDNHTSESLFFPFSVSRASKRRSAQETTVIFPLKYKVPSNCNYDVSVK